MQFIKFSTDNVDSSNIAIASDKQKKASPEGPASVSEQPTSV